MTYINPLLIPFKQERNQILKRLTDALSSAGSEQRGVLIEQGRSDSWGHSDVVDALKAVVGNKCWYSEVFLEGNDANVDHFRPKGAIREVDILSLQPAGMGTGYWWLAFDEKNYRLSSGHANQRRVDSSSSGGKANYFPVRGNRAPERTPWNRLRELEDFLPLDPCSLTDVALLSFDSDGVPGSAKLRGRPLSFEDQERVRISIWLYHLNKEELQQRRGDHLRGVIACLETADSFFDDWDRDGRNDLRGKKNFDAEIESLHNAKDSRSLFAGAVDRVIRSSAAHFPWINDYLL